MLFLLLLVLVLIAYLTYVIVKPEKF
nr:potassium-transporting ATPase subunit F [Bacilli bacterium]